MRPFKNLVCSLFVLLPFLLIGGPAHGAPVLIGKCERVHLVQDFSEPQNILAFVGQAVPENISSSVTHDLKNILTETLKEKIRQDISNDEFNQLLTKIETYAADQGINIHNGLETVGVFPEGLTQVMISGLHAASKEDHIGFARRHELAHLFHVVQIRAILLKTINLENSSLTQAQAEDYLKLFEGGANYRQFEKSVTSISGSLHVFSQSARSKDQYVRKVSKLLDGVETAVHRGFVKFQNGKSIFDIYALVLSKAPLIVGKSFSDLALRLPFILFVTTYLSNDSFHSSVDQFIRHLL